MQRKEDILENILINLKKCSLFENFKVEEIEGLLKCLDCKIKKYNKNDFVLFPGDEVKFIGIVLKGQLQVNRDDVFGNSAILSKINVGDIFGETIACLNMGKSPVAVTAMVESNIICLQYDNIINICPNTCKFHTKLISNMLKIIAEKNIILQDKIEVLACRSIREKLSIFLTKQVEKNKSNKFKISYSRLELANFLNVNRSALSRELAKMREEGILNFNKNAFEIYM